MIITKYGISLCRVRSEHVEMIREWRNDPKVSKHMFFRANITPAMQEEWFLSINNDQNYYFIIYVGETPCGLINLSSIDFDNRNAFAGLFIYEDKFIGTDIPVRASLTLLDVFFEYTNIEYVYAKVRDSNIVAHLYNTSLGFKRTKKIELGMGYEYCLRRENYFQSTDVLRKVATKIYGSKLKIEFEKENIVESSLRESFIASMNGLSSKEDLEIL